MVSSFAARSSLSKKSLRPYNCVHLLPMLAIVTPYSPHPDAIELPIDQIAAGAVFVSERNGAIVGFAALLPRPDGEVELDALFVDPDVRRRGPGRSLVDHCVQIVRNTKDLRRFALSAIPLPTTFTARVVSMLSERWRLCFGSGLLMRKMVSGSPTR